MNNLKSERLTLRQFSIDDTAFILDLVNSQGWLEFIGERNIKTVEAAIKYIEDGPQKSFKEHGFGLRLVELKDKTPIGMCGVLKRESLQHPDLGFAFLPQFSGKGYAFEAASATMEQARKEWKLNMILAITVPSNVKSIRLLEKTGFKFVRKMKQSEEADELLLFENSI